MIEQRTEAGGGHVITGALFRRRDGRAVAFAEEAPAPPPAPVRRPAKVAVALAMAHRIEDAITRGTFKDRADAARQLGVTRARVTQLLDLTLLAPDVQEWVLFSEAVDGVEPVRERALRPVAGDEWTQQRRAVGRNVG